MGELKVIDGSETGETIEQYIVVKIDNEQYGEVL